MSQKQFLKNQQNIYLILSMSMFHCLMKILKIQEILKNSYSPIGYLMFVYYFFFSFIITYSNSIPLFEQTPPSLKSYSPKPKLFTSKNDYIQLVKEVNDFQRKTQLNRQVQCLLQLSLEKFYWSEINVKISFLITYSHKLQFYANRCEIQNFS